MIEITEVPPAEATYEIRVTASQLGCLLALAQNPHPNFYSGSAMSPEVVEFAHEFFDSAKRFV